MILLVLLKYVLKYQFIKVYIYNHFKQSIIYNSKAEEISLHVCVYMYSYVILNMLLK